MGRTMYDMARESIGFGTEFEVKGFVDDNLNALDNFRNYPPLIGRISDYQPQPNDVFVCSIGGSFRKNCIEQMIRRGGLFINLIHQTARVGSNVSLGEGNLVGAFTTIAADAVIGNYNFIQSYTIIGHDVVIGDWNRIDSHVMCIGGIKIGDGNMIHTSAVLNHNVEIGNDAKIAACTFVSTSVGDEWTVFGNPMRRMK